MNWIVSMAVGALFGVAMVLFLIQTGAVAVTFPDVQWTLETTKYLMSAMIATVLFLVIFVYFG